MTLTNDQIDEMIEKAARIIDPKAFGDTHPYRTSLGDQAKARRQAEAVAKAREVYQAMRAAVGVVEVGVVPASERAFVRTLIREMRAAISENPEAPTITTGPLDPDILERVLNIALLAPPQTDCPQAQSVDGGRDA